MMCFVDDCNKEIDRKGLCAVHYSRQYRTGSTDETIIIGDDKRRLHSHCKLDANGCWVWQRTIKTLYGWTAMRGKSMAAHRASWIAYIGEIPKGMQVNHKCHNGKCINPAHLYLGTQKQNMQDMAMAGRGNHVKGSKSGMAKLDEKKVAKIKGLLSSGEMIVTIARQFGVSQSNIRFIKQGKTWKHV